MKYVLILEHYHAAEEADHSSICINITSSLNVKSCSTCYTFNDSTLKCQCNSISFKHLNMNLFCVTHGICFSQKMYSNYTKQGGEQGGADGFGDF